VKFLLNAPFKPTLAQDAAVKKLEEGFGQFDKQTLLGITGSGKTFVMANLIERVQKPTLVLAHNKTLAAQLYGELTELFPSNRVEYFISYFDYYQPESYMPTTDTYIEKDSSVNENIEKMRLKAMASLLSRKDVIIVASISCIYGISSPEVFDQVSLKLAEGEQMTREQVVRTLIEMQYERNDHAIEPGRFRVRGDVIDIIPKYEKNIIRVELFGPTVDKLSEIDAVTGEVISSFGSIHVFPAKQYVAPDEQTKRAIESIRRELEEQLPKLDSLEAQRLRQRTQHDIEMIEELGYCTGIENYSAHFEGRKTGERPFTLLDYFPDDFLFIIDESHQSIPQAHAMYRGDHARKKSLVDFGFRLPSAFDNRPLKFREFEKYLHHAVFVSATPGPYEQERSGQVVELIYRPTGLLDPTVDVRAMSGQIKDLLAEIKDTIKRKNRVIVTVLTKKMAEDLTQYLAQDVNVRYMHSEIDSLDRIELIRQLRAGEFDVLVGINLLREGLDIPEVELVAILDADKEGFLRDERSFLQTIGRAARNERGRVIMYADHVTGSMRRAIKVTRDRRERQIAYNKREQITPKSIEKKVPEKKRKIKGIKHMAKSDVHKKVIETEMNMRKAAEQLDFERAIELRDLLEELRRMARG